MQRLAQAWLILSLTNNNGVALGIESGLQFLPMLLFGAWGGVIADRFDKRKVLYSHRSRRACPRSGSASSCGPVPRPWRSTTSSRCLLGFVNVFDNPARQTFVMEMVGRDELPNAVGLNSVVMNSARSAPPSAAS